MMHSTGFTWQYPSRSYYGDAWLIIMALLLVAFGLVMMTSASIEIASRQYGDPFYHFKRQSVFLVMGLAAATVTLYTPMRVWYRSSVALLLLAYFMLILVLVPGVGREVNGDRKSTRLNSSHVSLPNGSRMPSDRKSVV